MSETTTAGEIWQLADGRVIEVADGFYPASCDGCGWVGSSQVCISDDCCDDSDVYCPRCHRVGADYGRAAQAADLIWKRKAP